MCIRDRNQGVSAITKRILSAMGRLDLEQFESVGRDQIMARLKMCIRDSLRRETWSWTVGASLPLISSRPLKTNRNAAHVPFDTV